MARVLIAMSGGVDSSVAAYLLKEAGHECIGVTMRLYDSQDWEGQVVCGGRQDSEDAAALAQDLGIPFKVLDYTKEFKAQIMEKFASTYEKGWTPNPCVDCNRLFKFGALYDLALSEGCDYVATGHYAQTSYDEKTDRYLLLKAQDPKKDQSYVLYSLNQDKLARTLFPLAGMTKDEVRALARDKGLASAKKKDSQDICFVPDGDYVAFIEEYRNKTYPQGDLIDMEGRVLGQHDGALAYTQGQRRGLGLALGYPAYVIDKDMEENTVTVGPASALMSGGLVAKDWSWTSVKGLEAPTRVEVKTRYQQKEAPALLTPLDQGRVRIDFDEAQRAITPGQAAVAYEGDVVLGGGTIEEALD